MTSFTGALAVRSRLSWYGQAAPIHTLPFLKSFTSWPPVAQYFLISGFCFFKRLIAALNCVEFNSYGSVILSDGCVFIRYSAASAIWIGLSGTVILPLYFEP